MFTKYFSFPLLSLHSCSTFMLIYHWWYEDYILLSCWIQFMCSLFISMVDLSYKIILDSSHLGFYAVSTGRHWPEVSVTVHQLIWYNIQENLNHQQHCCENRDTNNFRFAWKYFVFTLFWCISSLQTVICMPEVCNYISSTHVAVLQ